VSGSSNVAVVADSAACDDNDDDPLWLSTSLFSFEEFGLNLVLVVVFFGVDDDDDDGIEAPLCGDFVAEVEAPLRMKSVNDVSCSCSCCSRSTIVSAVV